MISLNDSLEPSNGIEETIGENIIRGSLIFSKEPLPFIFEKYNVTSNHKESHLAESVNLPINFNINTARVIRYSNEKYVTYTILLAKPNDPHTHAIIERRYTDFCFLQASLKKSNFVSLNCITFPPRIIVGNFQFKTIYERSRAFESYLKYLSNIREIFQSSSFRQFLMNPEKVNILCAFAKFDYPKAVEYLRNMANIEALIHNNEPGQFLETQILLAIAFKACKQTKSAWLTSLKVIDILMHCIMPNLFGNRTGKYYDLNQTLNFENVVTPLRSYIQFLYDSKVTHQLHHQQNGLGPNNNPNRAPTKYMLPMLEMIIDIASALGRQEDKAILGIMVEKLQQTLPYKISEGKFDQNHNENKLVNRVNNGGVYRLAENEEILLRLISEYYVIRGSL